MLMIIGAKVMTDTIDIQKVINIIQEFSKTKELMIQLFNADFIYGKDHLISAFDHAKRASDQDRMIADSLAMETLLYASGEYQIKNALAKLGIKSDSKNLAFIVSGELSDPKKFITEFFTKLDSEGILLEHEDSVLHGDHNTLNNFGISAEELAAVPEERWLELVLEKVALLDIQK
jgi:KEOPS complex subunit Cgi121